MSNPLVFCLMGPTASGKTALAIELCQRFPCDIISVDSAMVYRGMDIGTAKPTAAELAIAPHRLIDILDPSEPYSAGKFCSDARQAINDIHTQGRIPLLVGGTMLYFRALQQGLSPLPPANPQIRQQIAAQAEANGWPALHEYLQQIDPQAATRISPNDGQRIARALEVHRITGQTLTDYYARTINLADYRYINIGLIPENRDVLKQRIVERFKLMLSNGFVEEVRQLKQRDPQQFPPLHRDLPALRAVGYRQIWDYLAGDYSVLEMEERGIISTQQLAKRQLTWLRKWPNLHNLTVEGLYLINHISALIHKEMKM